MQLNCIASIRNRVNCCRKLANARSSRWVCMFIARTKLGIWMDHLISKMSAKRKKIDSDLIVRPAPCARQFNWMELGAKCPSN